MTAAAYRERPGRAPHSRVGRTPAVCHEGTEGRQRWSPDDVPCCTGDEGRPLEAAMQVEASNHLKLLWSKAMVVSVKDKVPHDGIR
jgi:hypothetical protein